MMSADRPEPARYRSESGPVFLLGGLLLGIILLQKLAVPLAGGALELPLPLFYVLFAIMIVRNRIVIDPIRMVLFTLLVFSVLLSLLLGNRAFSAGALWLFLLNYVPFLIVLPLSQERYFGILRFFIAGMIVTTGVVVVEQIVNVTIGHGHWPSMDAMLPPALLFPGFNYLQPMHWGSMFFKPNAFVFLEVSYLSQFLAIAIVCEFLFFRRMVVIGVLMAGLLLTFAGTGLLILAIVGPLLIFRLTFRSAAGLLLLGSVVGVAAVSSGWFDTVASRSEEFGKAGSSGNARYTAPLETTARTLANPSYMFTGNGPGNVPTTNQNPLPITKLITEYGVLTALSFYLLFAYSLFCYSRSIILAITLFVFFNLGGGSLSVPICSLLCAALSSLVARPRIAAAMPAGATIGRQIRKRRVDEASATWPDHGSSRLESP